MKLLQDLPSLVIEKIVCKLDYVSKTKLLLASESNNNLNRKIHDLCYIKRPKLCPFCMLLIGTDYEETTYRTKIADFHNQMLNRRTGDANWIWSINDKKCQVERACDSEKLEEAISCHLGDGKDKCYSLLITLKFKSYSKRAAVLNHIRALYDIKSHQSINFRTNHDLYEHIILNHSEFLDTEIQDPASLEIYFEKIMYDSAPTFNLPTMFDMFYRSKINRNILLNIACTYLVFVQTLEEVMKLPLDQENPQTYFTSQLKILFTLSSYTIHSMTFVTARGFNARTLLHIQRMLKLFDVLNSIFECIE